MSLSIPPSVVGTAFLHGLTGDSPGAYSATLTTTPGTKGEASFILEPIYGQIKDLLVDLVCYKRKDTSGALNYVQNCGLEVSINSGAYSPVTGMDTRLETPSNTTIYSEEICYGNIDLINDLGLDTSRQNTIDVKIASARAHGNNLQIYFIYRFRANNAILRQNMG